MRLLRCAKVFLLFLIPISTYASSQEKGNISICLNMIVRNESHILQRALTSVKGLIDYWVIVDTGSTDGTQELICDVLKDVPGELYERPWHNFGHNRTEALQLARGKSDYILFLDADDWLEYEDHFALPSRDIDIYWAKWQSHRVPGFFYEKPLLVKDSLFCEWEGVIHEYITCSHAAYQTTLDNIVYVFSDEGHRSHNPQKFEEAALILEAALEKEPGQFPLCVLSCRKLPRC